MKSVRQEILECLEGKVIEVEDAVFLLEQLARDPDQSKQPNHPQAPTTCSICGGELRVVRLECIHCHATMEGMFTPCVFNRLTPDENKLLLLFVQCRGNLKEMERELKLSYPTVRSRVETMLSKINKAKTPGDATRKQIKQGVEEGLYTVTDALMWFVSQHHKKEDEKGY
jgi:hypothetical protein